MRLRWPLRMFAYARSSGGQYWVWGKEEGAVPCVRLRGSGDGDNEQVVDPKATWTRPAMLL